MRQIPLKICGLTRQEDVDLCLAENIDWLGFNFCSRSRRLVDVAQAARMWRDGLTRFPEARTRVCAVVCDAGTAEVEEILRYFPALAAIQCHGQESSARRDDLRRVLDGRELWQAIRVRRREDLQAAREVLATADRVLFDAVAPGSAELGGTGHAFDWAGGVKADNVAAAVKAGAKMLDVCSGVESAPGVKDAAKLRALLEVLKS